MAFKFLLASIAVTGSLVAAQSSTSLTTTASSVGSTIVITATTGTPPPTVTFTATQNTDLKSITSLTTSSSTTYFPFGWFWVPIVPPGGLPPVLPSIPSTLVPPEATSPSADPTTDPACTSTATPTVTVLVTYSENSSGTVQLVSSTISPSGNPSKCVGSATTTTTTAKFTPNLFLGGPASYGPARPSILPRLAPATLQYFMDLWNKEGRGVDDKIKPVECSDTTYDKAIPSAVAFVKGLSPDFCGDWVANPSSRIEKGYTARDVKTSKARRTIQGRTPPPQDLTPYSYVNWKVDFSWEPNDVSSECRSQDYCSKQLSSLLTSCQGYSLADAYKSGTIEDGCGIFKYTVTSPPPAKPRNAATCGLTLWDNLGVKVVTADDNFIGTTPKESGFFGTAFHDWPTSVFKAAADNFCRRGKSFKYDRLAKPYPFESSQWYWINSGQQDSSTSQNAVCVDTRIDLWESQFVLKSDLKCSGDFGGRFSSNSKVLLSVIPSPNQSGCSAWKDDVYEMPTGDDCYTNFEQVIDQCLSTDNKGRMGVYKADSPENGCWDYWLMGVALD